MSDDRRDDTVYLFHVTFEENLPGIIEKEALIPGGNNNGFSTLLFDEDSDSICLEDAESKIFVFAEWSGMVPYVKHLETKGDKNKRAVVLRISIRIEELADFELFKDEGQVCLGESDLQSSWYFNEAIQIGLIEIARHDDPNSLHWPDDDWSFKPLKEYNPEEDLMTLPEISELHSTDEFDMSEAAREASKAFFGEATAEEDDDE